MAPTVCLFPSPKLVFFSRTTVGGRNPAPPTKAWNESIPPANASTQWSSLVSKWCETDFATIRSGASGLVAEGLRGDLRRWRRGVGTPRVRGRLLGGPRAAADHASASPATNGTGKATQPDHQKSKKETGSWRTVAIKESISAETSKI